MDGFKFNGDKFESNDDDEPPKSSQSSAPGIPDVTTAHGIPDEGTAPGIPDQVTAPGIPDESTAPVPEISDEASTSPLGKRKNEEETGTSKKAKTDVEIVDTHDAVEVTQQDKGGDQEETQCKCRSKCAMAAYCACRKVRQACTAACHPKNSKCLNI